MAAYDFADLIGIGIVFMIGIGFICPRYAGSPPGPKLGDPVGVRQHWGALQIAAGISLIGLVGEIVSALVGSW